ncbi:metallophosphoesterase family protein [Corynebacterium tuberculostearicum]
MKHHDEHFSNPHQADDIRDHYFERNNVLFIGLDSNASSDADIARHEQFLREAIESRGADNDWIVVGMHHGPYSQGTHYFDKDVTNLREKLTPVLSELNVDAVLSGHDHIYTRSHLMKNNKPVLPEKKPQRGDVLEPKDGEALYLTTTTAGGGKYYDFTDVNNKKHKGARMETIDPKLAHESTAMWRQDYTEDYMRVDVSDDKLTFTTFNEGDNTLVDKVSLKKKDRGAAPADDATNPADSTESTDPDTPEVPKDPEGGSSLSSSDIFGGLSSKK